MKYLSKTLLLSSILAAGFALVSPTVVVAANEDKKKCSLGEKWDKRAKRCVGSDGY